MRVKAEEVATFLRKTLVEFSNGLVSEVVLGRSIGKGTAVSGVKNDLDSVAILSAGSSVPYMHNGTTKLLEYKEELLNILIEAGQTDATSGESRGIILKRNNIDADLHLSFSIRHMNFGFYPMWIDFYLRPRRHNIKLNSLANSRKSAKSSFELSSIEEIRHGRLPDQRLSFLLELLAIHSYRCSTRASSQIKLSQMLLDFFHTIKSVKECTSEVYFDDVFPTYMISFVLFPPDTPVIVNAFDPCATFDLPKKLVDLASESAKVLGLLINCDQTSESKQPAFEYRATFVVSNNL